MTMLDSAIANLTKLLDCYSRDCDLVNFAKTRLELLAYQDVRDGIPRWKREMALHHADQRSLYAAHRVDLEQREIGGATMKAFTVVYAVEPHLYEQSIPGWELEVPVVRLAEVDKVLAEAVWAMEKLLAAVPPHGLSDESFDRIQAFLASPLVAAWRERQKGA